MPLVTPAEVQIGSSRMKIGRGSIVARGKRLASCGQNSQCVTARRPSKRPAAPSMNAPVHTEATRLAACARCLTHSTSSACSMATITPRPPAMINVSIKGPNAGKGSVEIVRPPAATIASDGPTTRNLIGRRIAALQENAVGRREHLKRTRDVEDLREREGEYLHDAGRAWRDLRVFWRLAHGALG